MCIYIYFYTFTIQKTKKKSSPNFTHVYTALIAIINTKLPDIVNLIIRRVLL